MNMEKKTRLKKLILGLEHFSSNFNEMLYDDELLKIFESISQSLQDDINRYPNEFKYFKPQVYTDYFYNFIMFYSTYFDMKILDPQYIFTIFPIFLLLTREKPELKSYLKNMIPYVKIHLKTLFNKLEDPSHYI